MYVTDATGLGIFDVSNPASPQIQSHLPLPRTTPDLSGAMHLVDVSDPAAPVIRASRPGPGLGLTISDIPDLSSPSRSTTPADEDLAWVSGEQSTFAFDITRPAAPRLVLGGPGRPHTAHWALLGPLARGVRNTAWPGNGAPVGYYVSAGSFWGAYLAPFDCPPLGSRGRTAERSTLSQTGESGRPPSRGRGPVPSPRAAA
jgi:LVIVD repeat